MKFILFVNLKVSQKQYMKRYVVIDLEMCNIQKVYKKTYGYGQEIIQIGAALMNESLEIIDKFNEYVKPKYGDPDKFITKLTGITAKQLVHEECLEVVMEHFLNWLPEGEVIAISWSNADQLQFINEMNAKGIEISPRFQEILDNWIDCQPQFSEKMKMRDKTYSLEEALIATDINTEGRAHDGLVDACNTALLYAKMQKEDELVLNEYYKSAHSSEEESGLTFSLGDILQNAINK